MQKFIGVVFLLLPGLACAPLQAGFRSPESLVRNVYAYYGQGSADLSRGLPRNHETAQQFFDPSLNIDLAWSKGFPYDFFVQGTSWKLGPIRYAITHKQFDKTYVAVAFNNREHAVTLNFVVVNGRDGWVILDVESPYDSLRSFLRQYKN